MLPLWLQLLITAAVVGLWMSCFLIGCHQMERRADQLYPSPQCRTQPCRRIGTGRARTMLPMAAQTSVPPQWPPRSSAELTNVG
jgi:hypothetical protein